MMIALCIYPSNFTCIIINLCISACVKIFINKVVYGTRVHWNTWGRVSQARKWVWKRDEEILNFCNKWLFGMDASGCADEPWLVPLHMHSGFPAKMVEQMIMTSWNDVMRISHAIEGGNYKRGSATKFWGWEFRVWLLLLLLSGCFSTSVRVFTKPQTLYLGCLSAPLVGCISWMYSVVCFYHKHASWPIWRTLSCYDFIYLMMTKVDHYLLP